MKVPFIAPILVFILGIPILSVFRSEVLFNTLVTVYFFLLTLWYAGCDESRSETDLSKSRNVRSAPSTRGRKIHEGRWVKCLL